MVATRARSARFSFGRRGCRRCRTASWWRRIRISAVFHLSLTPRQPQSRGDARDQEEHEPQAMIGDPHGRTAGRATLLVRATDEILGTHRRGHCDGPAVAVSMPVSIAMRQAWMWSMPRPSLPTRSRPDR